MIHFVFVSGTTLATVVMVHASATLSRLARAYWHLLSAVRNPSRPRPQFPEWLGRSKASVGHRAKCALELYNARDRAKSDAVTVAGALGRVYVVVGSRAAADVATPHLQSRASASSSVVARICCPLGMSATDSRPPRALRNGPA